MNASAARVATAPAADAPPADLVVLGCGQVGRALLRRLHDQPAAGNLRLVGIANSTRHVSARNGLPFAEAADALARAARSQATPDPLSWLAVRRGRAAIVVDASASEALADRHAGWLAAGVHVVTANKRGLGGCLSRWQAIASARRGAGTRYGASATVGAGLPLLAAIARLRAGGDRIHALAGSLSGTLAWLLDRFDGSRPFSALLEQARALGLTEPDPWQDLGGQDVERKLLILARAAGHGLLACAVQRAPLLDPGLGPDTAALDRTLSGWLAQAHAKGRRLRHVARLLPDGRARVGLACLDPDDPLAGAGPGNRLAIYSDRYPDTPLTLSGPGAGPAVTAAGLLDDILEIAGAVGFGRRAGPPGSRC
ncbi:MAG: homoserine dehydrogenase [Xanthomonadales bacterium]|nr:homoserine dehydrogenase [Xanthomonadales bacterium]